MSSSTDRSLEVKANLEEALSDQEVFIHLDSNASGVSVPPSLQGSSNVTLKLSYFYSGGLSLGEEDIEAGLLFPEGAWTCVVPYSAVWGMTRSSGETLFWPEHAPREILEEMVRGTVQEKDEKSQVAEKKSEKKKTPGKNKSPATLKRIK